MVLGIGFDLCEVTRMEAFLNRRSFLDRYFTEAEKSYILSQGKSAAQSLAGHFAAKEAGLKALRCGITLPLTDIAVTHDDFGAPSFVLRGKALARMQALGGSTLHLSITHTDLTAGAVAILEGDHA